MTITYGRQAYTHSKPMSLEEYLVYDAGTDTRYELVDGVLIEMGNESKLNVQIAMFLAFYLGKLGIPHYLLSNKAELVVPSNKVTTRYPDLVVLTEELEAMLENGYRYIVKLDMPPPAMVVEVVSSGEPGEENYDRDYVMERREYAARGVPDYWIVDPDRQVVWVLMLQGQRYQEQQFTGSTKIISSIFPALDLTAEQVLSAGK